MTQSLYFLDFGEESDLPAGKLADTILAYQQERQTGLVQIDMNGGALMILLFVRGKLVTAYRQAESIERIDPLEWLAVVKELNQKASLRTLALTPQDVRIFKILIEQSGEAGAALPAGFSTEKQFAGWMEQPVPALAWVRWPSAGALALFPGKGAAPEYTLFITTTQVLHSDGVAVEIYNWKEACESLNLYSSESGSQAWKEYLLHQAFSGLVGGLLGKFEKLLGRVLLNQIVRDVNFKAAAHDWNVSITANSVNDQAIFASPVQAGDVYAHLLEVILQHFESVLGGTMLEMLVREAIFRLPVPVRQVLKEYRLITFPTYQDVPTGERSPVDDDAKI